MALLIVDRRKVMRHCDETMRRAKKELAEKMAETRAEEKRLVSKNEESNPQLLPGLRESFAKELERHEEAHESKYAIVVQTRKAAETNTGEMTVALTAEEYEACGLGKFGEC